MQRVLESKVINTSDEVIDYDALDFTEMNTTIAQGAIWSWDRNLVQCLIQA
jgi:hypothetical protein